MYTDNGFKYCNQIVIILFNRIHIVKWFEITNVSLKYLNSSIRVIDRTRTSATNTDQRKHESNGNEGVHIPKIQDRGLSINCSLIS